MNTHQIPDTYFENQAVWGDLGPAVIVAHTGLTVPASSLTLAAVAANGYVLAPGPPARLVYVSQPAVSVTLSGGNGQFWLALHTDLSTAVAGWTRRAGSHYVWQMNATQPANPTSGYVFCQITVAGGVITAVTPIAERVSPPMSKQRGGAVDISGGTALGLARVAVTTDYDSAGLYTNRNAGGSRYGVVSQGTAPNLFGGPVQIVGVADANARLNLLWLHGSQHGIALKPTDADSGGAAALLFLSLGGTAVGSISTTGSATAYNTSSDTRLKEALTPLTDALATVARLTPLRFLWRATGEPGVGFAAQDVHPLVPEAVTGTPDGAEMMQMDLSKLVPYLVGACQELAAQVQTLTARLEALEGT